MQFTTIVDIVISSRHLIPLDVCHKKTHSSPSISFPFTFSPCFFIFFIKLFQIENHFQFYHPSIFHISNLIPIFLLLFLDDL